LEGGKKKKDLKKKRSEKRKRVLNKAEKTKFTDTTPPREKIPRELTSKGEVQRKQGQTE